MKKYYLVIAILFAYQLSIWSQDADHSKLSDSLIFTDIISKYISKHNEPNVLIEYQYYLSHYLPDRIRETKIIQLEREEIFKRTKNNKRLVLLRITPLKLAEDGIVVSLIKFDVSRKRKIFNYINLGGINIGFTWNCSTKSWQMNK